MFLYTFVIEGWFGYTEVLPIFIILALPEAINNFGYTLYAFLMGIGRAKFLMLIQSINVGIISLTLAAGFSFLRNYLGLLGYFISIIFVNVLMLKYVRKITDIKIFVLLKKLNIEKLLSLLCLLLLSTAAIYFDWIDSVILVSIISLVSLFIFFPDIKREYYDLGQVFIKNK